MTAPFTFRPATQDDIEALIALEQTFPPADRFDARAWRRLLRGHSLTRVACDETGITAAGTLLLRRGSTIARLYTFSVAPHMRGKGLSTALLETLCKCAKARNCTRMRLEVRKSNARAIALYRGAKFQIIYELPAYYGDGEDGFKMEKHLT